MIQIHFRNTEGQERLAWTEGLQKLGQREMMVLLSGLEHDRRDAPVSDLFRFLENYLQSQPKRILPGQTLRYGWTLLRFVDDEHNLTDAGKEFLLIEEMRYPFSDTDPSYTPGVVRALTLLQLQRDALRRNKVSSDAIYPHRSQLALVCTRVTPENIQSVRPLVAQRYQQPDVRKSGWFISCCDQNHNHDDPDELDQIHLYHLVGAFPGLFPYLAMPVGAALLFEQTYAVVFHPGEDEGRIDPGELLSVLPYGQNH